MRADLYTMPLALRDELIIDNFAGGGEEYAITDIGLRMLTPRELFLAQGFPADYIIGDDPDQGLHLTKSAQVRMCGNSVCPKLAEALVSANFVHEKQIARMA